MRRRIHLVLSLLLLLGGAGICRAGEIIDGLAAIVDGEPILRSDWERTVAFEALLQNRAPAAFSVQERDAVLERMIDQQLLLGEMGDIGSVERPEEKSVQKQVEQIRSQYPEAKTDSGWRAVLLPYGLTPDDVEERVERQLQVMSFIDLRLRPEAGVQRQEVEDYYLQTFVPAVRRRGAKEEDLASVYASIEEIVRQQHIDELLSAWMHNLRDQSNVQKLLAEPAVSEADGGLRGPQ